MNREEVISQIRLKKEELQQMGVRSLSLFGSVACNEATSESDIDLLVDLEPPYTFDRYTRIPFFLEDSLGHSVYLLTNNYVNTVKSPLERLVYGRAGSSCNSS